MTDGAGPGTLVPEYGPLAGLRVLESARYVAGPWASTYLGEFGAQVVHVEGPPFGPPYADPTRTLTPVLEGPGGRGRVSESWVQYGRNKLSVGLDVRQPQGREVFLDLVRASDIWIESSRPGTYDRLGLSDAEVWAANPRLTVVHISGHGRTGRPERTAAPSYDLTAQAYSGFLGLQGAPDPSPPTRSATALNDTVTGLASATAAIMGYVHAQRTGRGQSVDVAQYETFFVLLENLALDFFARGVVRGRHGSAHPRLHPYDVHRARDGWVVVAAPTPGAFRRLREVLGLDDPAYDDDTFRLAHREPVDRAIAEFCAARTGTELEAIGRAHDVAIERVRTIAEIAEDPHYRERGMFVEWDDPVAGRVRGAGIAPKFSATPGRVWRGAPWLGQDNEAVLTGLLGYDRLAVDRLRRAGVIGEDPPAGKAEGGRRSGEQVPGR
ncbi:MAG TPA: CoA transferase [Thermoplasmata archaeon]|nr:CoA transferase [Thermoplasmata archaeon]